MSAGETPDSAEEEEERFQNGGDDEDGGARKCCGACIPARQKPLGADEPRLNRWGEELDEFGEVLVRKDGGMYFFVPFEVYFLFVIASMAMMVTLWLMWLTGMEMIVPAGLLIQQANNLATQVNSYTNNVARAPAFSRYTIKPSEPVATSLCGRTGFGCLSSTA